MRKCWYRRCLIVILLLGTITGTGFSVLKIRKEYKKQEVSTQAVSEDLLIPGGMPVGIYMETDGVMVLGTEKIKSTDGLNYEPAEHLVRAGDYIVGVNGTEIHSKKNC